MILNLELKGKNPLYIIILFQSCLKSDVVWVLLWLLETNSTIPGHHTECPGALAITLQMWNWSYGCHIFVPPSEVVKEITWMQDGLQVLWVLEAVEEWRWRYKTSCLSMALWFQYRHWRVKASFLTSPPLTLQKFTSAIQKLLLSFLGSWCWWVIWEEEKSRVIALKSPGTPSAKFEISVSKYSPCAKG